MISSEVIHSVPLGGSGPSAFADEDANRYMATNRYRSRRRWAIRATLTLLLTAAALCVTVVLSRDQMTAASNLKALLPVQKALQAKIDAYGQLPVTLPDFPGTWYYLNDSERFYANNADSPVIVVVAPRANLALRSDGHGVIVLEQGKLHTEWMPVADFTHAWRSQASRMHEFQKQRRARRPDIPR